MKRELSRPHFVHILCYSLLMHYNPRKKLAGQVIYNFTKQLPFLLLGSCPGHFAYHCYLLQLIVFVFIFVLSFFLVLLHLRCHWLLLSVLNLILLLFLHDLVFRQTRLAQGNRVQSLSNLSSKWKWAYGERASNDSLLGVIVFSVSEIINERNVYLL